MLGNLLKQEFKATSRLLLPLYLILAVLTVVNRIVINLNVFDGAFAIIPGIITFAYVVSILAVLFVTFIYIIMRFYKNLITEEGYLMFTLPVKSHQLIDAKLIVATVWLIASAIGVTASLCGLLMTPRIFQSFLSGFAEAFTELNYVFGNRATLLIIEFIVIIILGTLNNILNIYVSIAIGQLFNRHKVIASFAAYMGINIILQIVVTILFSIFAILFHTAFDEIGSLPQLILPVMIIFTLVTNFVYYWGTDYIFRKKLNLE